MNDKKIIIDGIEVDIDKANKILKKVIIMEKTNLGTNKFNTQEMIRRIKDTIREELTCL